MADQNQNGIPDSWDRPLGAVLTLVGLVVTYLSVHLDPCPWWVGFVGGLTTAVGGAFKIGVLPPRWVATPLLALALLATSSAGCGYTTAAKITLGARDARDAVTKGMTAHTHKVTADCLAKCKLPAAKAAHQAAAAAAKDLAPATKAKALAATLAAVKLARVCYGKCIAPWVVHRDRFRRYAHPAVTSLISGAYVGIKLAKEAQQGKDTAIEIANGVACAVAKMLKPFLPLIPDSWRRVATGGLGIAERLVCK